MIRDRFKRAVRRAGLKRFGMEWDASDRPQRNQKSEPPPNVDAGVIPQVFAAGHNDGEDGGTPGAKHPTEIGRTWVAAQLLGGFGIVAVDVRSPSEWAQGHLPGSRYIPLTAMEAHLDLLPGEEERGTTYIAVYDAVGGEVAVAAAARLRELGFARARSLRGGYAEWVEEGEEVVVQEAADGASYQVGDSVALSGGRSGEVYGVHAVGDGFVYDVLTRDGAALLRQSLDADADAG